MRFITSQQMKAIDRRAIEEFGIPSLILMENAGTGAVKVALDMVKDSDNKKVVCVCGKGNNGGDGFVCARHLINNAVDTEIFLIGEPSELKADAKINFGILKRMKAKIRFLKTDKDIKFFKKKLRDTGLIIDAIFGIGLSGGIKKTYSRVIGAMNQSKKPILAIDAPSGLDATTGNILGICIKAEKTVTFGLPKRGFIKRHGPENTGELIVADISLPKQLLR